MRFDVNAPKPHYLTPESEKAGILCGRSATTSRGVLEAYSSAKAAVCDDAVVNVKGCNE